MQSDIRDIAKQVRQIESANYRAAMERASREIQHDNYRLQRLLDEAGIYLADGHLMEVTVEQNRAS
jgi:hypothetical protein